MVGKTLRVDRRLWLRSSKPIPNPHPDVENAINVGFLEWRAVPAGTFIDASMQIRRTGIEPPAPPQPVWQATFRTTRGAICSAPSYLRFDSRQMARKTACPLSGATARRWRSSSTVIPRLTSDTDASSRRCAVPQPPLRHALERNSAGYSSDKPGRIACGCGRCVRARHLIVPIDRVER